VYTIEQRFLSKNRSFQPLNPQGGVIHCTADPGATAENEFNYFNSAYRGASAHAFVDNNTILQVIPWDEVAWGSGPTSNNKFWQVEMCMPYSHDEAYFNEVWNRAVWLYAYLFNEYGILQVTNDNLMSHYEVSRLWGETTHTDPVAYFAEYGKTIDDYRAAVQSEIDSMIGGVKVEDLIIYSGDGDRDAAGILRDALDCYMVRKSGYQAQPINSNRVLVVGGSWVPDNNAILLTGSDRIKTAEAVMDWVVNNI